MTTTVPDGAPLRAWLGGLHARLVFRRRTEVLADLLAAALPADAASVADVGCGDGTVAHLIAARRPGLAIHGFEVAPRPRCLIECSAFDGRTLPLADASVDVCLFVDVLHHTSDVRGLLGEARRVTRGHVLIKDHLCETRRARAVLSLMDWVGNRAHGVRLPYNYQRKAEWLGHTAACGLRVVTWNEAIPLYPAPFDRLFGQRLHFVALLEATSRAPARSGGPGPGRARP